MPIDRELLRRPIEELRAMLVAGGLEPYQPDERVAGPVRAQFRFDLASLGVDTASTEALGGAVVGLAASIKAIMLFNLPPEIVSQFVALFDCVEPILDEDIDAEVEQHLGLPADGEPWGKGVGPMTSGGEVLGDRVYPPDDPDAPTVNETRERLGLPRTDEPWGERRVRVPQVGTPVSPERTQAVRDLTRRQGLNVPDDAVITDLSAVARELAGGQPDLHLRLEWTITTRDDGLIEATHTASGQSVVAPDIAELTRLMAEYNASLVAKQVDVVQVAPNPTGHPQVGGPGFQRPSRDMSIDEGRAMGLEPVSDDQLGWRAYDGLREPIMPLPDDAPSPARASTLFPLLSEAEAREALDDLDASIDALTRLRARLVGDG